jgi:hypothetical protein
MSDWEMVVDIEGRRVRRLQIPGGSLYQVQLYWKVTSSDMDPTVDALQHDGWSAPVFVPRLG